MSHSWVMSFLGRSDGEEFACNAGDPGLIPGVGKIFWREEWKLTPVFLPGESHGQWSLAGYSPWCRKESNTIEQLTLLWALPWWWMWKFFFLFKVTQSCLTLRSHGVYTVHEIFQARILEWITFPFSRGSSQLRDWTQVSRIASGSLPAELSWKPKCENRLLQKKNAT